MKKDEVDIHDRIFKWVISCLKIIKQFPNDPIAQVVKYQFIKACTSVGANDQEANNSMSKLDFVSKYGIVKKELAESIYWLKIIASQYPQIDVQIQAAEAQELLRIVSRIILNTKHQSP